MGRYHEECLKLILIIALYRCVSVCVCACVCVGIVASLKGIIGTHYHSSLSIYLLCLSSPTLLLQHGLDDDLVLGGQENGPVDIGLAVHNGNSAEELVVGVKVAGLPLGVLAVEYVIDEGLATADLISKGGLAAEVLETADADFVVIIIGLVAIGRQ